MATVTSLNPPNSVGLESITSYFHFRISQYLLYISYRLRANKAASSPPVPARISMTHFVRLASSPPIVDSSSSSQMLSRVSMSPGISLSANSRSSGSVLSAIARTSSSSLHTLLKRRYLMTSLASDPCSRATSAILRESPCTAGSAIWLSKVSKRPSFSSSISRMKFSLFTGQ